MLTVKALREKLEQFPDDAECITMERDMPNGQVIVGIVVEHPDKSGIITCGETVEDECGLPLQPIPWTLPWQSEGVKTQMKRS
jgi:hypothetical protein